jgi:hypothetical protein
MELIVLTVLCTNKLLEYIVRMKFRAGVQVVKCSHDVIS